MALFGLLAVRVGSSSSSSSSLAAALACETIETTAIVGIKLLFFRVPLKLNISNPSVFRMSATITVPNF